MPLRERQKVQEVLREELRVGRWRVAGFRAAGVSCGIKGKGEKDLALFVSDLPAVSSVVFTRNLVQAAPLIWAKERARLSGIRCIVVNSGNANACTGPEGIRSVSRVVGEVSRVTGIEVEKILPSSTGVIGVPLPAERLLRAVPRLVKALSEDGFEEAASAIMTTDAYPKLTRRVIRVGGEKITLLGVAKGAGMIAPNMGTMLAYVFTDARLTAGDLRRIHRRCVEETFNRIIVDGDTSTNDTAAVVANGASAARTLSGEDLRDFELCLRELMEELALKIVSDGEGATRVVRISVEGTSTDREAERVARSVGTSLLVKTAVFGADFNWGRIVAAAGRSGVRFDPEKMEVFFDGARVFGPGLVPDPAGAAKGKRVVKKKFYEVRVRVGKGKGQYHVYTSDLTLDYVKLNSEYTT
ncbi:MAG: bifunctional glutamate N-acetyltransferase/amino-acid acetyltransferase ArgJ [Deltaproteobacteria bacterium]|nr:MAG: bifunctional glutamate N-acetyltransferase/amino-acid acetyltransferase ArgJ [Deltaproteobacteria bacterium]